MCDHVGPKVPEYHTNKNIQGVGGQGGVCIFLEIDRVFEFDFGKLLGEIEFEFLRNSKYRKMG